MTGTTVDAVQRVATGDHRRVAWRALLLWTALQGDIARRSGDEKTRQAADQTQVAAVGGKGAHLGPDLTDIGSVRKPEQLITSLLDPGQEILPENRFYRVVTRDGNSIGIE